MLRILPVGEDQDHLATFHPGQVINARPDGVVESGRVAELQAVKLSDQRVAVADELGGKYLDLVVEGADLAPVVREHPDEELLRARHEQVELRGHAGTRVQHDHDGNRPDLVLEQHDLLGLFVVQDDEIFLAEVWHQTAILVGGGDIQVDDLGAGPKNWSLGLLRRDRHHEKAGREQKRKRGAGCHQASLATFCLAGNARPPSTRVLSLRSRFRTRLDMLNTCM